MNDLATYGVAAGLVVSTQPPGNVQAGSLFGFSVLAENAAGSLAQNFDGTMTVSLGNNATEGSLGGTLTVTAHNGVATFSGLTLDVAGSGYTSRSPAAAPVLRRASSPSHPRRLRCWSFTHSHRCELASTRNLD